MPWSKTRSSRQDSWSSKPFSIQPATRMNALVKDEVVSSGLHQLGSAGPGDVRHPVDILGNLREGRFMNFLAEAVEALEAHHQRPPLIRIDPVGQAIHQDIRMNVNPRHADFEADDLAPGDI